MHEDRPSSTATLIAAATVFLARDARVSDLVPSGAAEWCARCLEVLSRLKTVDTVSHPALRWAARLAERASVPGLLLHFMLRKRWIEEAVRAALTEACGQVVVIGAGFDTLALRLSREFPRVSFIEIDHPATQKYKRLAGERGGATANLHFIAADLSCVRLQDALSGGAYRRDRRSAFVIEGLLMYLTDAEVGGVFTALRELQRAGGRVAFTVMEPAPGGHSAFHNATPLVKRLLSRWSEPFKSALSRDDAARFLEPFGFRIRNFAGAETLRERYLAPSGRQNLALAKGEMIVLADCYEQGIPGSPVTPSSTWR
ncbi:MAG TPA: SAM-dependent methyltransferase [Burkholderiales bacterium]|nr:SAM-dependent methyltransferase [Burkholderiales bacterium]